MSSVLKSTVPPNNIALVRVQVSYFMQVVYLWTDVRLIFAKSYFPRLQHGMTMLTSTIFDQKNIFWPTSRNASILWDFLINLIATVAVSFTLVHFTTCPKVPCPRKDSTRKRLGSERRKLPGRIWSSCPGLHVTVECITSGFSWQAWMWT